MLSPDGQQIAFAAVGDIYVMPVGGRPVNLTNDQALDTDPAWSPDGRQLAYSSDKDSAHLQLWIRDMPSGHSRQVTHLTTQPQGATWSPDGTRLAFFTVTGMWRVAEIAVLHVASGTVTTVHETLAQPGTPTWSPDGTRLALAAVAPYSRRFREGTNQVLTMASRAAATRGTRRCRRCPSTRAAAAGRCGRLTGRRWPRFTKASSPCGRSPRPVPRWDRRATSPPKARTRRVGRAIRGISSIKRWTSCGSSTSRRARRAPCRSICSTRPRCRPGT